MLAESYCLRSRFAIMEMHMDDEDGLPQQRHNSQHQQILCLLHDDDRLDNVIKSFGSVDTSTITQREDRHAHTPKPNNNGHSHRRTPSPLTTASVSVQAAPSPKRAK
eukprot:TRINITY_DN26965_c0_g1_i1.p1 TRINITY_DN26965_c0_g1~~TRINITY_DN26965_c0_g1_i1.p1  ORF type:complete len:107 (+),score=28.41 TRINITY_DN26965_c0_g1_i1:239-559(+)